MWAITLVKRDKTKGPGSRELEGGDDRCVPSLRRSDPGLRRRLCVVEGTRAFRRSCLLTPQSHACCSTGKKGFRVRLLDPDRCGFDSHHPLQSSQTGPATAPLMPHVGQRFTRSRSSQCVSAPLITLTPRRARIVLTANRRHSHSVANLLDCGRWIRRPRRAPCVSATIDCLGGRSPQRRPPI